MPIYKLLATKFLTEWERNFLHSIRLQETWSFKQKQILQKIQKKVRYQENIEFERDREDFYL